MTTAYAVSTNPKNQRELNDEKSVDHDIPVEQHDIPVPEYGMVIDNHNTEDRDSADIYIDNVDIEANDGLDGCEETKLEYENTKLTKLECENTKLTKLEYENTKLTKLECDCTRDRRFYDPKREPIRKMICLPKTRTFESWGIIALAGITLLFLPGFVYDWQHFSILLVRSGTFDDQGNTEFERADYISDFYSVLLLTEHLSGVISGVLLDMQGNYILCCLGISIYALAMGLILIALFIKYSAIWFWFMSLIIMGVSNSMIVFGIMDCLLRVPQYQRTGVATLLNAICCSTAFISTPIVYLQEKYDWQFTTILSCWFCIIIIPIAILNFLFVDRREMYDGAPSVIIDAGNVVPEGSVWEWVSTIVTNKPSRESFREGGITYDNISDVESYIPAPRTETDDNDDVATVFEPEDTAHNTLALHDQKKPQDEVIGFVQACILGGAVSLFMAPTATLYTSKLLPYMGADFAGKAGLGFTIWNILACIPQAIAVDSIFPWCLYIFVMTLALLQANSLHTLNDNSNSVLNWLGALNMWTGPMYLTIRFRYTQLLVPKHCGIMVGASYMVSGSSILVLVIITKQLHEFEGDLFTIMSLILITVIPAVLIILSILEIYKKLTISRHMNLMARNDAAIHTDF